MPPVPAGDVEPGLVVHLDAGLLRSLGGSLTNAEKTCGGDRAVVGPHYFLVLSVDLGAGTCLAAPLFSDWAPGSERLDEGRKAGPPTRWVGQPSHFSRWQHWTIPLAVIQTASRNDGTDRGNRRWYARWDAEELARIAGWQDRNRAGFRPA